MKSKDTVRLIFRSRWFSGINDSISTKIIAICLLWRPIMPHPSLWLFYHRKGLYATLSTDPELCANWSGVNAVLSEDNRQQISHSLKRLRSTIDNADKLMSGIGGKSEDIENIISDLKGLSSKLEPIADSVSAAVNNVNVVSGKLAEANLKGVVEKAGSLMESVDNTVRSISAPLDSVLNNVDSLVRAIQANPKKYIKISIF